MAHPGPGSKWRVPFDGGFRVADAPTSVRLEDAQARLEAATERLQKAQRKLYADDRYGVLLVFQAMDAAGKDGTIRAVMRGVDPQGCRVAAFKAPSAEELGHDFLWRVNREIPGRGKIGIFNRSHYEEVLVVKVHPEFLDGQRLPRRKKDIFEERYESIRDWERHLYRNGIVVLKFFLNVSRDEQRSRFLARIDDPEARWKFRAGDVAERAHWGAYMAAYEDALNATSTEHAPWYAVPADHKITMRAIVAETIVDTLEALPLQWPRPAAQEEAEMAKLRAVLEAEPKDP